MLLIRHEIPIYVIKKIKYMKDEIYILHQPKHSVISIVLVDSEFPVPQEQHESLDRLLEFSDVFFVFPKSVRGIGKEKFTSLYEGCGWIEEDLGLPETYLHTILYSLEIFECHVGFCISRLSDLTPDIIDSQKIINITGSSLGSPVFKTRKLTSHEFYDIYKETNSGIFKTRPDSSNMYASYTSGSPILYFKRSNLGTIIDFWRSSEDNKYIKSFTLSDPRYFFASVCKFLGIGTLDSDIHDLDIGRL